MTTKHVILVFFNLLMAIIIRGLILSGILWLIDLFLDKIFSTYDPFGYWFCFLFAVGGYTGIYLLGLLYTIIVVTFFER